MRLMQGDFARETVYQDDVIEQARQFFDLGVRWLHIVDLDGALVGESVNAASIESVLHECAGLRLQLGGGIRNLARARYWLEKGVERVVLGTFVAEHLRQSVMIDGLADMCASYPGRLFVALDCRDGRLAGAGWTQDMGVELRDAVMRLQDYDIGGLIYTDIARDGALVGPDSDGLCRLASWTDMPLIASGGVRGWDDIETLADLGIDTLVGVISGRAFYEGHLDMAQALRRFPHA